MTVQGRIVSTSKTDLKFVRTIPLRPEIIFVEREKSMLKILTAAVLTLSLAACASGSGGSSQMYGEIKAGVETSHQR